MICHRLRNDQLRWALEEKRAPRLGVVLCCFVEPMRRRCRSLLRVQLVKVKRCHFDLHLCCLIDPVFDAGVCVRNADRVVYQHTAFIIEVESAAAIVFGALHRKRASANNMRRIRAAVDPGAVLELVVKVDLVAHFNE